MPKICFIVTVVFLISAKAGAQAASPESTIVKIADSLFAKDYAAHRYTSAAFVFVQDTSVKFANGYGEADAATHSKVDPARTIFRIASISKLFAATAVMQLAESRKIDLDADINQYLKTFRLSNPFDKPVSAASLLTHTSGLENRSLGSIAKSSSDLVPLGTYFSRRPPHVDAEPGSEFSYSNNGMGLAGYLVEAVSGERFDDYVANHILIPLGMTSATFRQPVPPDMIPRIAGGKRTQRAPLFNPYPAGALMATPMDMSRFIIAQLNGGVAGRHRILSEAALNEMQRTHWTANEGAPGVAYGFFEGTMNGHRVLFHTGDSGHHGIILLVPDLRIGFYAVYDTQDDGSHEMMETLARSILGEYPRGPIDSVGAPQATVTRGVARYTGIYGSNGADPHTIEKAAGVMQQVVVSDNGDGKLRLTPSGFDAITAAEVGPDLFKGSDGAWVSFKRHAAGDGQADELTITGGISDPFGVHRLPWYADARIHKIVFIAAVLAILSRIVVAAVAVIRRRKAPLSEMRFSKLGWKLSGLLCLCVVLIPPSVVAGFAMNRPPIVSLPGGVKVALGLLAIASLIAVSMPAFAIAGWRDRTWSAPRRVYFAVFAACVFATPFSLAYWNLLSFRF